MPGSRPWRRLHRQLHEPAAIVTVALALTLLGESLAIYHLGDGVLTQCGVLLTQGLIRPISGRKAAPVLSCN